MTTEHDDNRPACAVSGDDCTDDRAKVGGNEYVRECAKKRGE
ncbi:MAG TPA: hypothetical protein VM939_12265 [Gemmatimonadaceae bacterium]|nr:hypothetical protein [Gemmatimonadaceae bacterium]